MRTVFSFVLATIIGLGSTTSGLALVQSSNAQTDFDHKASEYLSYYYAHNPIRATGLGIHSYDDQMPDWSETALKKEAADLEVFQKQFENIDAKQLDLSRQIDRQLAINDIKSTLLDLQSIKPLEKRPNRYSEEACESVFSLIKRPFAPLPERMKLAIKRMALIPVLLDQGKTNLKQAPKICVEIALEEIDGSISFFKTTAPQAFASVKDAALNSEFKAQQERVLAALEDYKAWLKQDLLPRSLPNFAIGKDNYEAKIAYDEMVDTPLEKLLGQGYSELKRLQDQFVEVAKSINPNQSASEVFVAVSAKHPQPQELVPAVNGVLNSIRQFCIDGKIVSIPSPEPLHVENTPEFERALSFASMDTAGPFEKVARDSYYYVTPVEPTWSKEKIEQHMRFFSNADLINTSVHETFPGHYVQFLWIQKTPSDVRKVFGCSSNAEGWAHYCEEMMLDQGLNKGDKELKLVQLHDALLRCCRYIVGIQMHTQGMKFEDAVTFFMKEGYQEKANAERESKRGTMDPTYLVYTLGKLEIKKLRADYKEKMGDKFTLQDFHDKFLAQGCPPIKLVRQALLAN
jgi:uncharacterized protein (DUF885 family)